MNGRLSPCRLAHRRAKRKLHCEWLEPRALLAGQGLVGQYFHNPDFTGLAFERTEAVDFAWGEAPPAPGIDADSFSVRWQGQLVPLYSETYTIRTVSDEGVRLWIDGRLLIDRWDPHPAQVDAASVALEAGRRHDVRLEYYDRAGTAQIRLQWTSPSQPLEAIPASALWPSPAGLRGVYADATGNAAVRVDGHIDFAFGLSRPLPGIDADRFHVTWTGQVRGDFSETYEFVLRNDEGARLWIGGELVIDHWGPHPLRTATGAKQLEAGKWHDVRLEYRDVEGEASVEWFWSSPRQTPGGEPQLVPATHLRAAPATPLTFANPLGPGADPFVLRHGDFYYHIRSTGSALWIDRAADLTEIHPTHPSSDSVRIWTPPIGTNYSRQLWAPELHLLDGKWYVYVAASNGDNATHRMHVLERDAADPFGPFVYRGQLAAATDRWAIDGTVLPWGDKLYFVWSGWSGTTDGQQNLYIAAMSDPLTIVGERALLSVPQYPWERFGMPINEGPQVLVQQGRLHLIYSASGYWTHQYALGRLTYAGAGDLMDSSSWEKSPVPVFQQAGDIVGTGHASFTTSPDGTEPWIMYHAHHDPDVWQDDRDVYLQPFRYDDDGYPDFGPPLPATEALPVPRGVPDPARLLLPGDFDASATVDARDLAAFEPLFGQTSLPWVSADGDGDGFVGGGDLLLWQRQFGASAAVSAAGASAAEVPSLTSSATFEAAWADWPAASWWIPEDLSGLPVQSRPSRWIPLGPR